MEASSGSHTVTSGPPCLSSINYGADESLPSCNINHSAGVQNAFAASSGEMKTCSGLWQDTDSTLQANAFFFGAYHHGTLEGSLGQASNSTPRLTPTALPTQQLSVFPHFSTDGGTTTNESGTSQIRRSSSDWEDDLTPVQSQSNEHSRAGYAFVLQCMTGMMIG